MKVINLSGRRGLPPKLVYCGRAFGPFAASPLGNPCSARDKPCPVCKTIHFPRGRPGEAGPSVQCYRRWLFARIRANDRAVIGALLALPDDATLGCWCVDLDDATRGSEQCHCEVVAKAARYLKGQAGE